MTPRRAATFEEAVLAVIATIPPGEVMTYGDVAGEAGHPGAARAVGNLLRRTTAKVPWWRVVGADGRLRSPDANRQASLLAVEGWELRSRQLRSRAVSGAREPPSGGLSSPHPR